MLTKLFLMIFFLNTQVYSCELKEDEFKSLKYKYVEIDKKEVEESLGLVKFNNLNLGEILIPQDSKLELLENGSIDMYMFENDYVRVIYFIKPSPFNELFKSYGTQKSELDLIIESAKWASKNKTSWCNREGKFRQLLLSSAFPSRKEDFVYIYRQKGERVLFSSKNESLDMLDILLDYKKDPSNFSIYGSLERINKIR